MFVVNWKEEEQTKDEKEDDTKEKVSAMGVIFFIFKIQIHWTTLTIPPISFLLSCETKGGGYEHEGDGRDEEGDEEGGQYKGGGDEKGGQYEGEGDKIERSGYEGEVRCYRGRPRRR